jgi:hypothetical protein
VETSGQFSYHSEAILSHIQFSKGFKQGELNISKLFILPMYLVIRRENPNAEEFMERINLANN